MTARVTGDPRATGSESGGHARGSVDPSASSSGRTSAPPVAEVVCEIWGVLNVTPDSFSDGGAYLALDVAIRQAVRLLREGAHVLDIGGESSRPSGTTYGRVSAVSEAEELQRVLPVIEALKSYGARISIDTVKAGVAERAVRAGAAIINDVSCGRSEALLRVAAESGAELVLMHNRGRGEHSPSNVRYGDVAREVRDELMGAVDRAVSAGVEPECVWVDPGIGFAKTAQQSAALLAQTDLLVATGHRVLVGASRKSFIAELAPLAAGGPPAAQQRLGGSAAAMAIAVWLGARAVRVHDVRELRQAAEIAAQLREARP
ncbi:MAG: Dihydropteroate synthase [Myxococcaceae bacterium]|nr:Dihydropteroate synthase [Myxococcaceae bacterium]